MKREVDDETAINDSDKESDEKELNKIKGDVYVKKGFFLKVFEFLFYGEYSFKIFISIFILSLFSSYPGEKNKKVDFELFSKNIHTLLNNNADITTVKLFYDSRDIEKSETILSSIFNLLVIKESNNTKSYFSYELAFSQTLNIIKTNEYLSKEPDRVFLKKLEKIINENNETNPFDRLESGQRDLFENIRVKLGDDYPIIDKDLNKLTDELSNKNSLVNEYLSDSKTSLFVSIASAVLAVLLAVAQMWQSRQRKVVLISDILDKTSGIRRKRELFRGGKIVETSYADNGMVMSKTDL